MPDMYSDNPDSPSAPAETKKNSDAATALLPKNFFPGDKPLTPGNKCVIEIDRDLGDQVSVTYSHAKDESEDEMEVPEEDEVAEMME